MTDPRRVSRDGRFLDGFTGVVYVFETSLVEAERFGGVRMESVAVDRRCDM